MTILTLGPEGTFSSALAKHTFPGGDIEFRASLSTVFDAVEGYEKVVIPLYNDVSGFVTETTNRLLVCPYHAEALIELPIAYNLVGYGTLEKIHTLYTFSHTYRQCYQTLKKHLPGVEVVYTSSNGVSAQELLKVHSTGYAALLPATTGMTATWETLIEDVHDCTTNATQFLILSKKPPARGRYFLSFLFSRMTHEKIESHLKANVLLIHRLDRVLMDGIECACYFLIGEGDISLLQGIQYKHIGFVHEIP